jgi:hypothetical protein
LGGEHRRKLDKGSTRVPGDSKIPSFPLSGQETRKHYADKYLNSHEMTEVEEFEEVWYLSKQD